MRAGRWRVLARTLPPLRQRRDLELVGDIERQIERTLPAPQGNRVNEGVTNPTGRAIWNLDIVR